MSLRSVALFVLLAAAVVVAQWSDILYATTLNVTPSKLCDPSNKCVYVVKIRLNVSNVIVAVPGWWGVSVVHPNAVYSYSSVSKFTNIYMPAGLYYSLDWGIYNIDGVSTTTYVLCGRSYRFAVYLSVAKLRNVSNPPDVLYYVDPDTCNEYVFAVQNNYIYNITSPWVMVYLFQLAPVTRRIVWTTVSPSSSSFMYDIALNGTEHLYRILYYRSSFVGSGFYIANYSRVPTIMLYVNFPRYGPVHFSALKNTTSFTSVPVVYNIAQAPSDGIVSVKMPSALYGEASLAAIANDTAVYVGIVDKSTVVDKYVYIYGQRYAIYDVSVADDLYTYNTRTVACPQYAESGGAVSNVLIRLDRAYEIEICSNRTDTTYLEIKWDNRPYGWYTVYIDILPPSQCRRVRWDGAFALSYLYMNFYNSSKLLCQGKSVKSRSMSGLTVFMRYNLLPNYTLVPVQAVDFDALYEATWRQLIEALKQQYNATQQALQNLLQSQQNLTQSLVGAFATQPRFVGTIRIDSATSTWLKTTLNELQKYQEVGASASFGMVALPAVPAAVAPAAAAAVAVAWAASRRDDDVAATAAVAGIAIALFGVLMTLIYGTSSLTLVALGVIVAAAAAAWRRIT